jgi:hypothetical protein
MSFRVLVLRCAKTVRTKRWSHWHRQDDGGMQETPDQTNKETSLLYQRVFSRLNSRIVTLVWVFECWFCDARKTVKKKRWSHWHGQDDGGSYTKAPNNLLPVSQRVSAVFSPNHYFVLLKQRSILANLGFFSWTIWVFHHSTTAF